MQCKLALGVELKIENQSGGRVIPITHDHRLQTTHVSPLQDLVDVISSQLTMLNVLASDKVFSITRDARQILLPVTPLYYDAHFCCCFLSYLVSCAHIKTEATSLTPPILVQQKLGTFRCHKPSLLAQS